MNFARINFCVDQTIDQLSEPCRGSLVAHITTPSCGVGGVAHVVRGAQAEGVDVAGLCLAMEEGLPRASLP